MPKLIIALALFTLTTITKAQTAQNNFSWLLGQWKGEGSGKPGEGTGTFTFAYDLDKKVIVRKSHSEYPATDKKPLIIHDDLMVVYNDATGAPAKAIYFDNEGHTINYNIAYADKTIILLSEKTTGAPIFRLSYALLDAQTVNTKFEISNDGQKFMTYVEGKSVKVK